MLQSLQNNAILRSLWGLMSLYVLNCCIDVPNSHFVKEDLNLNKQESILELIIEKLLGFENAVAEYEDCDTDSNTSVKKNITIDVFVAPSHAIVIEKDYSGIGKQKPITESQKALIPFFEIHSPPPEI